MRSPDRPPADTPRRVPPRIGGSVLRRAALAGLCVILLTLTGVPAAGEAPASSHLVWRAPFARPAVTDFAYLAASAYCAHATFLKRPTFDRTTGGGSFAGQAVSTSSGCAFSGLRRVEPWVDWIFNSTNFTGTGVHRYAATWELNWSVGLFANASLRGPACPSCVALAAFTIGAWIELVDLTTQSWPCPVPCSIYSWSVHHLDQDAGSFARNVTDRTVRTVSANTTLIASHQYEIFAGIEAHFDAGARGNGSTATAYLALGSGHAHPGVVLREVRLV
ncbi:MAG TPA: hypothetical protein VMH90_04735 [Thermoplasmata archaeon]|nr:hypothetical protein [Thermoplasmata archaeon]